MPGSPLETVLRLRQRAVDDARQSLASSLLTADAADEQARTAEQRIEIEAQRATSLDGGDDLVEAFAAWLPGARQQAMQARAAHERLAAEVACRRAELAASRSGLEVIETLLRQKRDVAAAQQSRRMQQEIDEAGSRCKPAIPG